MAKRRKKRIKRFRSEICKKYPDICEIYPWLEKEAQKLSAKELKLLEGLIMEYIDALEEVDMGTKTLKQVLREYEEKKAKIEEVLRQYEPPPEIRKLLEDPTIPLSLKEEVVEEYLASLRKPMKPPKIERKVPEAPVRERELVHIKEEDVYISTEEEMDLVKRLLKQQHNIIAERIDFIIRMDRRWQVIGIDQYGRSFCVTIKI